MAPNLCYGPQLDPQQVPGEAVWELGQGALSWTLLGEFTALPRPLASGEKGGCPLPKNPTLLSARASAHQALPLTQNRRLGPSQHEGLDLPMSHLSV